MQNRKQQNQLSCILVNFMTLATDIGSFIDAGRLFHNIDPLNFNNVYQKRNLLILGVGCYCML